MVNNILSRRSLKAEKEIIEWEEVYAEDIVEIRWEIANFAEEWWMNEKMLQIY